MNILYVTISFPKEDEGGNLYTDLAEEIAKRHNITVLVTEEKKKIKSTQINKERNIEVIRTKVGNMYNVSFIEKAITYLTLSHFLKKTIRKLLKERKFDIILYTSPPVTIRSIVKYAKKKFGCMSYLMQKDIFPQNAVDIGIMKKNSLPYEVFRRQEKDLYKISDKIGCMSKGNMKYLIENNKDVKNMTEKVEFFPNTIKATKHVDIGNKDGIKEKYNIPKDKVIALYGGNFGKPQGIEFIIQVLIEHKNNKDIFWIFSGKGTEKEKLFKSIEDNRISNVLIIDYIPRDEYRELLSIADIGLIFLDSRFTIPNIPSRLLTYLEYSIPILAATDKNTDLNNILEKNNIGVWCESDNVKEFTNKMNYYIINKASRKEIGQNGRKYLETNLTVDKSLTILENAYNEFINERKDSNV